MYEIEPEGYLKISERNGVYYFDVYKSSNAGTSSKRVGIGSKRYPNVMLEPAGALKLLSWLERERETLEKLAKEEENE